MANPWDNDPVVGGKTSTPEEFAQVYGPAAERAGKTLGVDPKVILGQWGLETGWGKSIVPGTNNLGNIKDFAGGGVEAKDNMTGSRDKYRAYASPEEFADDYSSLIQRKYPDAMGAKDPMAFAQALKAGGYAEDPRYVDKVAQAARMAGTNTNPVVAAVGKAVNAAVPSAHAAQPNYGNRPDGSPKGKGFFGELKRPDGGISTEVSVGVNIGGKEMDIPLLVPTLTRDEVNHVLAMRMDEQPPEALVRKAAEFAKQRLAQGKGVFASAGEEGRASVASGNPWDNDPIVEPAKPAQQPESRGFVDSGGAAFGVYAPGRRAAENNTPNATEKIIVGGARGVKDVIDTGAQIMSNLGGSGEAERVRAMNEQGKQDFQRDYGDSALAGAARTGGNIVATTPVGGIIGAPLRAAAPYLGPVFGQAANKLANTLTSSGFTAGEGGGAVSNMLYRMAGGGGTGYASAGLVDPASANKGAVLGAALPPAARLFGGAGGAVAGGTGAVRDMATKAGQSRIAEDILRASATNPTAAAAAMSKGGPVLKGSSPTMAQVANDPGLAQLERTLLQNPEIAPGLQQRFAEQRAARAGAIDDVAGRGTYYDDIKEGRSIFANEDYAKAMNTPIDPAVAQEMAPQIASLMERPSIKSAIVDAKRLAAETGETIDDIGSVRGLDWVKKSLDNKISRAQRGDSSIGTADLRALQQTKRDLMSTIEQLSPAYKEANDNFAKMSRQVNTMDVARELDKAYTPVAANFGQSAKEQGNQYMKALTQAQESVKKSTGMDRPLSEVMDTADIYKLENVGRDLARKQYAESAGNPAGSATAQNMMSQQMIRRIMEGAGLPAEAAAGSTLLNTAMWPVNLAGRLAVPKVNNRLAELALNPEMAAEALRRLPPKEAAQALASLPPNKLAALAAKFPQIGYRAAPVLAAD